MEILITGNNWTEYIIDANKYLWRSNLRKTILFPLFCLIAGIASLVAGINQGYDQATSTTKFQDISNTVITNTTQTNYHITFGLGISFLLLFLYFIFLLFAQRQRLFKTLDKICNRHKLTDNKYTFRINEQGVFYQNFELTREEKWSVFSKFKISKEYLFVIRDDYPTPIPLKNISNNDLSELLNFLRKKSIEII